MSKQKKSFSGKSGLLPAADLSLFCSQVCMVLRAAIPLSEGISAIGDGLETDGGKALMQRIQKELEQNGSFSGALKSTGVFPNYMLNMVSIGEKTGKLDDVTEALSLYYAREDSLRSRIISAITYPLVLTLMMAVVISVLVIKVLPVFNGVLRDMGTDLTAASNGVLRVGTVIGQVALIVIALLAIVLAALLIVSRTQVGSRWLLSCAAGFKPTRRLLDKVDSARFASVLSSMLSSGYDTSEALELIPGIITNPAMIDKIAVCRKAVEGGDSFPDAMERANLFPGIYGSMVRIGTKTGNLEEVMKNLADLYSQEVDASIDKLIGMIEPVLVGVLSVIIGAILLSIMLPLMGVMSSIG